MKNPITFLRSALNVHLKRSHPASTSQIGNTVKSHKNPLLKQLATSALATAAFASVGTGFPQIETTLSQLPVANHPSPISIKELPKSENPYQTMQLFDIGGLIPVIVVGGLIICVPLFFGGLVVIGEREVGIVVKKFALSGRGLPPGHLIALNGEAGYQADTLAPGWHWGYWPWQYNVRKESVTVIPQGEIALVVAADGTSIPAQRILGKIVACDNFQDARKFLKGGGEKGRQLGILTAGTYRINTALFTIITAANAQKKRHDSRSIAGVQFIA